MARAMAGCTPSWPLSCWPLVYQEACAYRLRRFKDGSERHGHVWFRWFNEVPILLLLAAVVLVVVKPF